MTPGTAAAETISTDESNLLETSPAESEAVKAKRAAAVHALTRANTAKTHELLFEAWDVDEDGVVVFLELSQGVGKLQAGPDEIHLQYVAEAAAGVLDNFDSSAYQRMDRQEFRDFVELLTQEMGKPFAIVSEMLLLSALEMQPFERSNSTVLREIEDTVNEESKQAQRIETLSQHPNVEHLFSRFNRSGSGEINFSELCHMLHSLRKDISLREARAQAVNTMLLCDTESKRALSRLEFARFIQKLGVLLHVDAPALAETLLEIAEGRGETHSQDDAATASSMDNRDAIAQVYETLADRKLHLLFELWDKDGDGSISFAELSLGLRKFSSPSQPVTETASDAAEALLLFDIDSDQKLDRAEFARFVNQFCEACGADFNTLSEFLSLLAALEDNPSEELAFLLSEDKVDSAVAHLDAMWRQSAAEVESVESAANTPAQPEGRRDPERLPSRASLPPRPSRNLAAYLTSTEEVAEEGEEDSDSEKQPVDSSKRYSKAGGKESQLSN